jgi:hypothetical protein
MVARGLAPPTEPVAMPGSRSGWIHIGDGGDPLGHALRHLDFGLQDRLQARQSVQECDERLWSEKDARQRLAALLRPLKRRDRIGTRWSRDRRSGGRERFRPVRSEDPGHVVAAAEMHALAFEHRRRAERWNSPTARNRGRHGGPAVDGRERHGASGSNRSRVGSLCTGRGGSCRIGPVWRRDRRGGGSLSLTACPPVP